jgi:hypothetical protein
MVYDAHRARYNTKQWDRMVRVRVWLDGVEVTRLNTRLSEKNCAAEWSSGGRRERVRTAAPAGDARDARCVDRSDGTSASASASRHRDGRIVPAVRGDGGQDGGRLDDGRRSHDALPALRGGVGVADMTPETLLILEQLMGLTRGTPMTPDTVHLLAQWLRHTRGMLTAFEKWLESQPTQTGR